MKSNAVLIDEDTFHQVCGEDDYQEFLKNNPDFLDYYDELEKRREKKQVHERTLKKETLTIEEKVEKKEQKHTVNSVEDFKCFMMLTWLELYLPRYAMKYGDFSYSSNTLDDKQKINELLNYYSNCGITDIEDIRRNSFRAFHH